VTAGVPFSDSVRLYLQAEALRREFPAWGFAVQSWTSGRLCIEAVNRDGGGLYALISSDPAEIWRELRAV
jgi:hypothetical protein